VALKARPGTVVLAIYGVLCRSNTARDYFVVTRLYTRYGCMGANIIDETPSHLECATNRRPVSTNDITAARAGLLPRSIAINTRESSIHCWNTGRDTGGSPATVHDERPAAAPNSDGAGIPVRSTNQPAA
jgi:hypothetical protein